jgi:hypothetical protein
MPVSDTTILRSLKEHARTRSNNGAVHVAGIDDWAWRKGVSLSTQSAGFSAVFDHGI